MKHTNRLTEYFREHPEAKPGLFSSKPIQNGLQNCDFSCQGSSFFLPPVTGTSEGIYDSDGNLLDPDSDLF